MAYRRKSGVVFSLPTLIYTQSGENFPNHSRDLNFYPGVLPILRRLFREGYFLFLLCNAPEVAAGEMSLEYMYSFLEIFQESRLPGDLRFTQIYYECSPNSDRFMPCSGMLREVQRDFLIKTFDLLIVGRDTVDYQCARTANVDFCGAEIFFNTMVPKRI